MIKTINVKSYLASSIALITLSVYSTSLRHEFIEWDDRRYILENLHIRSIDTTFLKWIFFDFYAGNWHPLTWLSHALDFAVWGFNPLGHHLTNILLHSVNTFLVVHFIVTLLQTAKQKSKRSPAYEFLTDRTILLIATITGFLFGLHPVHVESVAWIAERKDLLCALFFLLSMTGYVNYVSVDGETTQGTLAKLCSNKNYLLSLGFFTLALLSKPMAVTLPIVLLILDWYPMERMRSYKTSFSALVEKLPFIALSLVSSILTVLAQQEGGAIKSLGFAPFSARLLVAAKALIVYLWKMIYPMNLVPFYPYPKEVSFFSLAYGTAIVLVMGMTIAFVVLAKKQKLWLGIWAYYVVTIAPVLGIVLVGQQSMADRYTYLPSLGPFLIIGLLVAALFKIVRNGGIRIALYAASVTALSIAVIVIALTVQQISIWRNSIVFWSHVIKYFPSDVPFAYKNRGVAYAELKENGKAMEDYTKAIFLDDSDYQAYTARGTMYAFVGQHGKAIEDLNRALLLNPNFYVAYYQRAIALENMGKFDHAAEDYDKAISLNPLSDKVLFRRGILYIKEDQYDKAIEYISKSIAQNPYDPELYRNRGIAYVLNNDNESALKDVNKAIDLDSHYAVAYYNRATIHQRMGKAAFALADFRKACDLGNDQACNALKRD